MSRFLKHIFICNNKRDEDDPRGCCTLRGSEDLLNYLKGRVHEMGLKGKVRINKAGCLDACQYGPSIVVYPDDVWYSANGTHWQELPDTPWNPRHAASVFVFDDALWIVAGNNMEKDVWKLVRT